MESFFQHTGAVSDQLYCRLRTAAHPYDRRAKRLTERMWRTCGQFVDANALQRAQKGHFYAVWWELFVAYCLHSGGVSFVPTKDRLSMPAKGVPDLLATNPRIWIEAVIANAGNGPDCVTEPPDTGAYDVPLERIVLRLCNSIDYKAKQLRRYLENGTISASDTTIIAVSGAGLPLTYRIPGYPIPDIVRAVCGVGYLGMEIDIATGKQIGTHVQYQDHLVKKSNNPVATDLFLQKESAHVSAVLYNWTDCWNNAGRPGADFILVHNPNATIPVPDSWLPVGRQYWLDGRELRRAVATRLMPS